MSFLSCRRRLAAPAAVALATLSTLTALVGPARAATDPNPVVRLTGGALRGASAGGVDSFLGIRYAQPPTGNLRWRPAQPARAWTGVADATRYGARCPALASNNGPQSLTEDCLFINVQRPADTASGAGRPVYVFFHGGAFGNGGADQHDGTWFIQNTGALVVTMNFRLGVFGFMGSTQLTGEGGGEVGNYGFTDQQLALRWVKQNIGAFGGDPAEVTIGGQSSGADSVCNHLAAPGSRGLFARAIMESTSCAGQPRASAEAVGPKVAAGVGCTDPGTVLACLRAAPVADLLLAWPAGTIPVVTNGVPSQPTDPRTAISTGAFAHVPVLVGGNLDESRSATADLGTTSWGQPEYTGLVDTYYAAPGQVLGRYPWPASTDPYAFKYAFARVLTDSGLLGIGSCTTQLITWALSLWTPTYVYEWADRNGPGLRTSPAGFVWGAGHAAELPYMWPSFNNGSPITPRFSTGDGDLAQDVTHYWGSFVTAGRPAASGRAGWPLFNLGRQVMSLLPAHGSKLISDDSVSSEHQCTFWDLRTFGLPTG